jgi:hypothetical protein
MNSPNLTTYLSILIPKKKTNKNININKQGTYRYGTPGAPDAFNASRYELKELKKKLESLSLPL